MDDTLGDAVQGYYSSSDGEIVVISENKSPTVSTDTLVHELVHALQDQQFGLGRTPARQDPSMARNGLIEGEATLVTDRYFDRCSGEWSCIEQPQSSAGQSNIDRGILSVILQPYEDGPAFIEYIMSNDGWEGIDDAHSNYPESTAQIIHPEQYPDETPTNVSVADRSTEQWDILSHAPTRETVGEAAVNVMLRHNGIISSDESSSYAHPVSAGWTGDELVPYRNNDGKSGYVWQLEWETSKDALAFYDAYRELLTEHGAVERGKRQFVIPEGTFSGAFDVRTEGTTVTIVHGPAMESLDEIYSIDN